MDCILDSDFRRFRAAPTLSEAYLLDSRASKIVNRALASLFRP